MNNVFIDMLRLREYNPADPISFREAYETIAQYNIIDKGFKPALRRWFYENYYHPNTYLQSKGVGTNPLSDTELKKYDKDDCYITGTGLFKLIQYQELQTAEKHASDSMEAAIRANKWTIVAFLLGLVSAILSVISFFITNIRPSLNPPLH